MSDVNDWNKKVIAEFRENGGNFEGSSLVLLHTTDAKSGLERINPLMCIADGDTLHVIASKAGAPKHPGWYHNIVANPSVTIEYGTETFEASASILEEPERTRIYEMAEASYAFFSEYKQKAGRVIPVIALNRA